MRRNILIALALFSSAFLAACGSTTNTLQPINGVPMSLTIGDAPPSGVGVLFFEASITGATLQPSDSTKASVSVLTAPVEIEFGHLQTDTAFLSLAKVTPDTYKSITLTFGNAVLTIVNHSGATIGTCPNNTVCQLTPSFASSPTPATTRSALRRSPPSARARWRCKGSAPSPISAKTRVRRRTC